MYYFRDSNSVVLSLHSLMYSWKMISEGRVCMGMKLSLVLCLYVLCDVCGTVCPVWSGSHGISWLGSHVALRLSQEGWGKPVNAERRVVVFYIGPGLEGQPVVHAVAPAQPASWDMCKHVHMGPELV